MVIQMTLFSGMLMEYCQWDVFNASCPRGEVIVMESAQYGRMELGRCLLKDYGYVGCGDSVLPYLDSKCSGRRSCTINIPDRVLDKVLPCPGDLKSYLQASYTCIKGTESHSICFSYYSNVKH